MRDEELAHRGGEQGRRSPLITIRELLRRDIVEQSPLSLANTTLQIANYSDNGITTYAAIVDYPLTNWLLPHLLNAVAPIKVKYPSNVAVLADFDMPDFRDDESQRLLTLHQELGEYWIQFEKHRSTWGKALRNFIELEERYGAHRRGIDNDMNALYPVVQWSKDAQGNRKWLFSPLDEGPFANLAEEFAREVSLPDRKQLDTLAGLHIPLYLCQDEIPPWPEYLGLPGSDGNQGMRGPQVALLAMMRQKDILRASFFPIAEKFAEN